MFRKLFVANIKGIRRDPGLLFVTLFFPAFYSFIFGLGGQFSSSPPKLAVIGESRSPESVSFYEALTSTKAFEVTKLKEGADLKAAFDRRKLDGVVFIPDLAKHRTVRLVFDERGTEKLSATIAKLRSFIQGHNLRLVGATEAVTLGKPTGLRGPLRPSFEYSMPPILMFSVIFTALSFGATRATQLRERGVFKRLMVTPLNPRTFMFADMATRMIIAAAQTAIVIIVGTLFYHLRPSPALAWLFLLASAGNLVFIGLGFAASSVSDHPDIVSNITSLAGVMLIFFSGGLPLAFFPPGVVKFVSYFPMRPMIESIRGVVIDKSSPLTAAPTDTAILAAWLALALALAYFGFKFREPSKRI